MLKIMKTIGMLSMVATLAIALVLSPVTYAGEHPEHPSKDSTESKEHPEHPEHPESKAATVTVDDMAKAITDYISADAALKGGFFFVYDAAAKSTLELTLDKVHTERLSQVGDNLFFACSDFKNSDGKMYDLDFFMESMHGKLQVTEIMIHKEEGKPRYTWAEEDGVWIRK